MITYVRALPDELVENMCMMQKGNGACWEVQWK